jgi:streptogramin lyase
VPASASAFTVQEVGGLNSGTSGVVLGPDGNIWAAEEGAGSVVRVTPSGQVLNRYPVGSKPTSMAIGPGGRVWVSVTGADMLVWLDATSASPSVHSVSTGAGCGPVAIVSGGDGQMYFSLPSDGPCGASKIGHTNADGSGGPSTVGSLGQAFDLEVLSGKLFIPDFEGDVVRRVALGTLSPEAEIDTPAGSGPDGIAADGAGNLWVTLFSTGRVAHFPASQGSGEATALTPTGGVLSNPFGIVAGADGSMYVASPGNAKVLGITATLTYTFTSLPFDAEPWQVANGPNGEIWVTDQASTRLFRLYNPSASGGDGGGGGNGAKGPPKLTLSGKKVQQLGRFVKLKASCPDEACTVSATGSLRVPSGKAKGGAKSSSGKQLKLQSASVHVGAGRTVVLKLKLPAKVKNAVAAALKVGKKPVAKIKARAVDGAGNSSAPQVRRVTLER